MWKLALAALAVALAVSVADAQDGKTEWPSNKCLDIDEPKQQGQTIKLQFHDWDSHNMLRWAYAIILKEALGYTIEFVDSNATPSYMLYEQLAKGIVDINSEVWGASKQAARQQWVVEDGGAEDLGYMGTSGTETLFISSDFVQSMPPSVPIQFYSTFSRPDIVGEYLINATTNTRAAVQCRAADGSLSWSFGCPAGAVEVPNSFACTDASYPAWQCQQGVWYTDACCAASSSNTCSDSPSLSGCMEVWYPSPGWSTGLLEQITQNLNVPASFVYHGSASLMQSRVEEAYARGQKNPVYFWFYPDPWFAKLRSQYTAIQPLVFPPWSSACYDGITSSPDGPVACAPQSDFLAKVVNSKLKTRAPTAYNMVKQFQITSDEFDSMFDVFNGGASYFDSACSMVRAKFADPAQWSTLVSQTETESVDLGSDTAKVIVAFAAITLILAVAVFVAFAINGANETVRDLGLACTGVQLLGFALLSCSAIAFCAEPTTGSCGARMWLLALGSALSFSPLLTRLWALNHPDGARFHDLWAKVVAATTLGMVVLMAIWHGVSAPEVGVEADSDDWQKGTKVCQVDDAGGPATLLGLYCGALGLVAFVMAARLFDVPTCSDLCIAACAFVTCAILGTFVPLAIDSEEVQLRTYIQAAFIMVASLAGVVFLFVGKAYCVLTGVSPAKAESRSKIGAGGNDAEVAKLRAEVAQLRSQLQDRQL